MRCVRATLLFVTAFVLRLRLLYSGWIHKTSYEWRPLCYHHRNDGGSVDMLYQFSLQHACSTFGHNHNYYASFLVVPYFHCFVAWTILIQIKFGRFEYIYVSDLCVEAGRDVERRWGWGMWIETTMTRIHTFWLFPQKYWYVSLHMCVIPMNDWNLSKMMKIIFYLSHRAIFLLMKTFCKSVCMIHAKATSLTNNLISWTSYLAHYFHNQGNPLTHHHPLQHQIAS